MIERDWGKVDRGRGELLGARSESIEVKGIANQSNAESGSRPVNSFLSQESGSAQWLQTPLPPLRHHHRQLVSCLRRNPCSPGPATMFLPLSYPQLSMPLLADSSTCSTSMDSLASIGSIRQKTSSRETTSHDGNASKPSFVTTLCRFPLGSSLTLATAKQWSVTTLAKSTTPLPS